ncbi:MAG: hypothetical protein LQ348_001166 [Seirophora lacunosa]|nr:MAG: hypothetical protein LQ348_001166 [Seirophora lacunosa]
MAFFLQFDLQDHSIITLQLFWRGNRIDGYNVPVRSPEYQLTSLGALAVSSPAGRTHSTNGGLISIHGLGVWPAQLPFRIPILYSSPPAYLQFTTVRAIGSAQDTADFVRICDMEIRYWIEHPTPRGLGPRNPTITRKFTDVFLGCQEDRSGTGAGIWSMRLAIGTLNTLRGLVEENGLREYEFSVAREDGKRWTNCRIYLHNPYGPLTGLAGS